MALSTSEQLQLLLEHDERLARLEKEVFGKSVAEDRPVKKKGPPKQKKSDLILDFERLEEMSDTELAQICRYIGNESVYRNLHRDDLIAIILGEEIEAEDPVQMARVKTHNYITGNRRLIQPSLYSCDLYCPNCPHDRVVECMVGEIE